MHKLMAEDNLNASVNSAQDEMVMCGQVAQVMDTSQDISDSTGKTYDGNKITQLVILEGSDNFAVDSILCFIEFKATLSPQVFKSKVVPEFRPRISER